MTIQNIAEILITLALVGWAVYRQLTWRVMARDRLWKMPLILAGAGVLMLAQTKGLGSITLLDAGVLLGELVLSIGLGALMGVMAVFRTRPQRESDVRNRRGETGSWSPSTTVTESRTGGWGLVLWIVLIGVRVGIDIVATQLGAVLITATGTILLVLAVNRLTRALVIMNRIEKRALVTA
jgi:hypothetical protein